MMALLTWLSELIWRDFYFQIIANFPHVSEKKSFKSQFENLPFENDENKFEAWKNGLDWLSNCRCRNESNKPNRVYATIA